MEDNRRKRGRPRNTAAQQSAATERQRNYISQWEKDNYDKALIRFPRGTKERIAATGQTLNGFTVSAVLARLNELEAKKDQEHD